MQIFHLKKAKKHACVTRLKGRVAVGAELSQSPAPTGFRRKPNGHPKAVCHETWPHLIHRHPPQHHHLFDPVNSTTKQLNPHPRKKERRFLGERKCRWHRRFHTSKSQLPLRHHHVLILLPHVSHQRLLLLLLLLPVLGYLAVGFV